MEEWKTYKIGEICESVSDTYRGKALDVVLVNTSDVYDGVCLNHTFVPNKNLKGQFKKTFKRNDILYSEIRPANKRFAFIDFEPENYIASTKLMVIRCSELVRPRYLYHYLKRQEMLDELQALAESRSGTFPQITFSELALFEINLPNLATQDKIVAAIDCFDDKIALNNRINHNLEEQAQALYKSWFVDFEPFKEGKFVSSELGMIPKGWEVLRFNEFTTLSNERVNSETIPEFSVTNNGIFPRDTKFNKQLSSSSLKNKIIRKGDLVFGMSRDILNWGVMDDLVGGVSSAYTIYRVNSSLMDGLYLKNYMNQHLSYFKDLIRPAAREGQGIDKGVLATKIVYRPSDIIWSSFLCIFSRLIAQIQLLSDETQKLIAFRDTILPELMEGRISIKETS